ncbi:MAG: glycerol-3-phosphate 1-O-acyltransferase PlsY [Prevotellaceae bacterium]|jgi:glycerol-3-phosphate acyltransferase PlsY|nr:glycerol-3-phosphate 1-O-acyltransferase PlsY [Prevotellaceae bacterium]
MSLIIKCFLPVIAYLAGSISTAIFVGKRFFKIDIRNYGSKNAGATNILRVLGPKAALPVFIFDLLKGVFAVVLVRLTDFQHETNPYVSYQILLGICVVAGHIFPIFAKFKGGKGVATTAGVILAMHPYAMLMVFGIFGLCLLTSRYVSFSSVIAAICFPLIVIIVFGEIFNEYETLTMKIFSLAVACMIIFTHRNNIKRLLNGTESKITFRKKQISVSESSDDALNPKTATK